MSKFDEPERVYPDTLTDEEYKQMCVKGMDSGYTLPRYLAERLHNARRELAELREFARDCADNWDCDTGANLVHHPHCRSCAAYRLTSILKPVDKPKRDYVDVETWHGTTRVVLLGVDENYGLKE